MVYVICVKLEGIHHITAITADAQENVDFYAGVLGLRLVKKTVNQDNPSVYHLFFADERGDAGSDLTFFEFPGVPAGRAGSGDVHRIVWRVGSTDSLDFWAERLGAHGIESERAGESLRFADPEGLGHELLVATVPDAPLIADHPEVPGELALQGFHAVRAYGGSPEASAQLLEALEFERVDGGWEARGSDRGGLYLYDDPPAERPLQGAGSVHHVAWASSIDEHEAWRERAIAGGAQPTPVIDRFYFRSIYFREPSGVLFEIATLGPGFTVDEPLEQLGEKLSLPPDYEHLRAEVEPNLRPVVNPRTPAARRVSGDFVWRDAGRVIVLRRDGVAQAPQLLHQHGFDGFELLTTPRALPGAPELEAAARAVHAVPAGQVPEAAAALLDRAQAPQLVALGGGRVIDTAKAVAAVSGARVAAVPTTLSGAEITGIHRLPAGAEQRVRRMVRPELAIADPEAMTGLAERALRASAMNSPRARRRLPLHALRQPGLADDRAARRRAARRGARRRAVRAQPRRARPGLAALRLRDRLRRLRPPPRDLPDPRPHLRHPPRRDQRRHPPPRDGLHGPQSPRPALVPGGGDRHRSRQHRTPHPRARRQPSRPGRARRRQIEAGPSSGLDAVAARVGVYA